MATPDNASDGSGRRQPRLSPERFKVDPRSPLPMYDSPGGKAFEACDSDDPSRPLYALVHSSGLPCRTNIYKSLLAAPVENLINPVTQQILEVDLHKGAGQYLVTFFERPLGGTVLGSQRNGKLAENFIKGQLTKSLVQALAALHERGLNHRAIRPENLFFIDAERSDVVLGECVSAPPGSGQHPIFEPLETAYADPLGRGRGNPDMDNFALGVTLLSLFRKQAPTSIGSLDEMYSARVSQGSYQALVQRTTLASQTASLLRGLISDDPRERWTLKEVALWLEGHSPRLRAAMAKFSLSRPVIFMGHTYSDRRLLSHALASNTAEAADLIRRQDFSVWIQQILAGEAITERTERLILSPESLDGSNIRRDADALVARFCALLDPTGPLRFRGLTVCFDAVPAALAAATLSEDQAALEAFRKLLGTNLIKYMMDVVVERNKGARDLRAIFRTRADKISSSRPGLGLERFLYDTNPSLPCLSPYFKAKRVGDFKSLLVGLDEALGAEPALEGALDLHFCAFAASQVRGLGHALGELSTSKFPRGVKALALLEALGAAQSRYGVGLVPNIATALANGVRPLIAELHFVPRQKALEKILERAEKIGDLGDLVLALDFKRHQILDSRAYTQATALFAQMENRRLWFSREVRPGDKDIRYSGYQAATLFGGLVLISSVIYSLVGI